MRQKEDAFVKERERLIAEIDTLHNNGRVADERVRELEMENEAMNEVIKKMNLEAKEAKMSSHGEQDAWNERLRNIRRLPCLGPRRGRRMGKLRS